MDKSRQGNYRQRRVDKNNDVTSITHQLFKSILEFIKFYTIFLRCLL